MVLGSGPLMVQAKPCRWLRFDEWPADATRRYRRLWSRRASLFALLVAVAVFVSVTVRAPSPTRLGAAAAHSGEAARGLVGLPVAAQGAVSRALGRADPSYGAHVEPGGFVLRNRGQGLVSSFRGGGVEVRSGRVWLGLSLRRYGYGRALGAVAETAPRADANGVVYRRGRVHEWYANGPLGLEQGFTLNAPPVRRGSGALTLALELSGDVRATLGRGLHAVTFAGLGGAIRYRGLVASDALGRTLASRIELIRGWLLIRVDDAGARYPLQIDPFIQQAKLTASDGATKDNLGYSVAVSDRTIVASAPFATVGANRNQGAVYVFVRRGAAWGSSTETAKLTASDGKAYDNLGYSVAISGKTIVASAPSAVGANGGQGAVYVFVRSGGLWASGTETAKLTASDGAGNDRLGYSVDVSGKTIVAGAPFAMEVGIGRVGAVYVFVKSGARWASGTETAKLTAANGSDRELGQSVGVSGNTIVAGAPSATIGANSFQGAAYVFIRRGARWASGTENAILTPSDGAPDEHFGFSIGISDNTIVAGAPQDTIGANSGQGAVYVFVKPAEHWANATETAKLTASDGASNDALGWSVAVSDNTIVAGAFEAAVGANGLQGAAYVFVRSAQRWANGTETAKLTASDGASQDFFGYSVAVSDETIVVGAPFATIRGNNQQGAAYVFE